MCMHKASTKIIMQKLNDTEIFIDEVETQLREKPLGGNQTQDIHYLEDKARYKIVTLTYTRCSGRTLLSNV
jgi:cytochrome oxidase assembly protein ShyY1